MNKQLITLSGGAAAVLLFGCTTNNTTINNNNTTSQSTTIVKSGVQYADTDTPSFNIDDVIKKMGRRRMRSGSSADAGVWVVYKVNIGNAQDKQQALALAEIRAKRSIGEWMQSTISKKSASQSHQEVNGDTVVSTSVYNSLTKVNSEAFLRGVTFHSFTADGTEAYFYVTGKIVDRSAELEAQLKAAPPGVVRAVGFGIIADGKIAPAKRQAMQSARRNAVEQVMGTTVIGQSQLMDNDKAKSKVISQTAGNIKEYRIVKEDRDGMNYQIIINAKVDEKSLLDNYAAMVRSMGNPGFAITAQDPDVKAALGDFFATLGFKVTANPADTQFLVDADCKYIPVYDDHYGKGLQIDVSLKIVDVKNRQQLLFAQNNPRLSSTYSGNLQQIRKMAAGRAFKSIKKELHEKLNKVVMDWVLNGREVTVVFKNASDTALDEILAQSVADVPCAKFQTRSRNGNTLVLHCSYVGPSADFEEFLRERMKKDLPQGTAIPATKKIELNSLEFAF